MDPFVAEIRLFPFGYAPQNWAQCNGQLIAIRTNPALFSIIGTYYGGDGRSNFALPNLQGLTVVSSGQSPGNMNWVVGQTTGSTTQTLQQMQMPLHGHGLVATSAAASQTGAAGAQLGKGQKGNFQSPTAARIYSPNAPGVALSSQSIGSTGGNQPHNNMMPYLTLNFCIALQGVFPTRS